MQYVRGKTLKFTVKELSEELGISKQAIFNQINRNSDLKKHIEKRGNKFYIDEKGQEIIRNRSVGNHQNVVVDQSPFSELEALKKENSDLKDMIIRLQVEKQETAKLIADAEANKKLLEESQINVRKIMNEKEVLREENKNLSGEIDERDQKLKQFEEDQILVKNAVFEMTEHVKNLGKYRNYRLSKLMAPSEEKLSELLQKYDSEVQSKLEELKQVQEELKAEKAKTWWQKLRGK